MQLKSIQKIAIDNIFAVVNALNGNKFSVLTFNRRRFKLSLLH